MNFVTCLQNIKLKLLQSLEISKKISSMIGAHFYSFLFYAFKKIIFDQNNFKLV